MPRQPRIDLPGVPQHLVQRGNDRRPCFFAPIDRTRYLDELRDAACRYGCAVHAYVLMTNHVHLLLTPARTGCVSTMMQSLGRRYVRYINDRYRRTGTLWEGRFKACPVQSDDHLLRCYRYIELNPVRAGMVSQARKTGVRVHFLGRLSAQPPFACRFPARYLGKGTLTPVLVGGSRKVGQVHFLCRNQNARCQRSFALSISAN